jgi:hypothetical protein
MLEITLSTFPVKPVPWAFRLEPSAMGPIDLELLIVPLKMVPPCFLHLRGDWWCFTRRTDMRC